MSESPVMMIQCYLNNNKGDILFRKKKGVNSSDDCWVCPNVKMKSRGSIEDCVLKVIPEELAFLSQCFQSSGFRDDIIDGSHCVVCRVVIYYVCGFKPGDDEWRWFDRESLPDDAFSRF